MDTERKTELYQIVLAKRLLGRLCEKNSNPTNEEEQRLPILLFKTN